MTQARIKNDLIHLFAHAASNHDAMHKKAGEMMELMRLVRMDALRRKRMNIRMLKAAKAGNWREVKNLQAEMSSWRKYKIV